jgi:RNA polymerase sigma-70 factor, ECF subfamily
MDEAGQAWARGRAAHPRIKLPAEPFGQHYARAVEARRTRTDHGLAIEDLYLACACANGISGAAAVFEAKYGRIMRRAVSRVLVDPAEREEAVQAARQLLLVGTTGASARIGTYLGQGPLENWVAVAVTRLAISLGRAASAERRLLERVGNEALAGDPERLLLKGEIRRELEGAVKDALRRLEDRQRMVLRLWLVSGTTLAAIGKVFGVTQQSVSRWLADAREAILADVQRTLAERMKVAKDELPSFARLIQSQLDFSISRLLSTQKT